MCPRIELEFTFIVGHNRPAKDGMDGSKNDECPEARYTEDDEGEDMQTRRKKDGREKKRCSSAEEVSNMSWVPVSVARGIRIKGKKGVRVLLRYWLGAGVRVFVFGFRSVNGRVERSTALGLGQIAVHRDAQMLHRRQYAPTSRLSRQSRRLTFFAHLSYIMASQL
jgi:hypothetical protein